MTEKDIKQTVEREENPFEDRQGAEEWIRTVENEQGTIRDKEIYPQLVEWVADFSPSVVVDIGAGQGVCSSKLGTENVQYIGIEPSTYLVQRAEELYKRDNRRFLVGSAYDIPLEDAVADACFSITTWFHLSDIQKASQELSRVLKSSGHFMIITPNPAAYDVWESFYSELKKEGKLLVGKVDILLNPDEGEERYKFSRLSKNTLYLHSLSEMVDALKEAGLELDAVEEMGILPLSPNKKLFIKILGHKK